MTFKFTLSIHCFISGLLIHFLAQIILNSKKLILLSTICLILSKTTILSTFHPMMTTSKVHLSRSWITFVTPNFYIPTAILMITLPMPSGFQIFLFPQAQFIPILSLTDPFYFRRCINDDDYLDFSSHADYISTTAAARRARSRTSWLRSRVRTAALSRARRAFSPDACRPPRQRAQPWQRARGAARILESHL